MAHLRVAALIPVHGLSAEFFRIETVLLYQLKNDNTLSGIHCIFCATSIAHLQGIRGIPNACSVNHFWNFCANQRDSARKGIKNYVKVFFEVLTLICHEYVPLGLLSGTVWTLLLLVCSWHIFISRENRTSVFFFSVLLYVVVFSHRWFAVNSAYKLTREETDTKCQDSPQLTFILFVNNDNFKIHTRALTEVNKLFCFCGFITATSRCFVWNKNSVAPFSTFDGVPIDLCPTFKNTECVTGGERRPFT